MHSDLLQPNEYGATVRALPARGGEQGVAGIVSEYRRAGYRSGHTDAWIKVKVPGWTEANRRRFACCTARGRKAKRNGMMSMNLCPSHTPI